MSPMTNKAGQFVTGDDKCSRSLIRVPGTMPSGFASARTSANDANTLAIDQACIAYRARIAELAAAELSS